MLTGTHSMSRWLAILACLLPGMALLVCGLLVPAHLRAVDAGIIEKAGRNTPALIDKGLALVSANNLGSARLLLQAAQQEGIAGRDKLDLAVTDLSKENPGPGFGAAPCPQSLPNRSRTPPPRPARAEPRRVRSRSLKLFSGSKTARNCWRYLKASPQPGVQELLRLRAATNTVLFPPSQSASGQPLDAALALCGLLFQQGQMSGTLSNRVEALAAQANRGGNSQPIEEVLMDVLSLGQRFDWGQLTVFVRPIEDAGTLRVLTDRVRNAGGQLPALFSSVHLSGNPRAVADYLGLFSRTGETDLGSSLRYGAGGVNELLRRKQRLDVSGLRPALGLDFCLRLPWLALGAEVAYVFVERRIAGRGIALCKAGGVGPGTTVAGARISFRPRDFVCAGFPACCAASERAVSRPGQPESGIPLSTPSAHGGQRGPCRNATARVQRTIMSQTNLFTLLLFFVLQGLLFTASLLKLAEIRRQKVPAPHQAEAARKRGSSVRCRPLPGLFGHHRLVHHLLAGRGQGVQPHGRLFLHVVRHHLRVRIQNPPSAPRSPAIAP